MLDGCFIRHKTLQILRVSLSHCYGALPLAWEVSTSQGNVELEVCEAMLDHVADLLKRMHVEESFRDDKSGGFDLHASHLTDPKRLDTLLLALSVAVL
jgi:hypothetical protein